MRWKTVLIAAGLLSSAVAWAYVPPSQYIVKSMTTRRMGLKVVRIRSQVVALDGDKPTDVHFKATTVYSAQTQTLRSWATDSADKELYRIERKAPQFLPADALLFELNPQQVAKNLKDRGIPIKTEEELLLLKDEEERRAAETERLVRWKGQLAWVIGPTDPKDKTSPQLWVEKDSFFPARLIADIRDTFADIRFEGFRLYRELPYPRTIYLARKDDTLVLRDDLVEINVNPSPKELKFPVATGPDGFTDEGNAAPGKLRELIRQYYELVR
jgi:hypothetical protein